MSASPEQIKELKGIFEEYQKKSLEELTQSTTGYKKDFEDFKKKALEDKETFEKSLSKLDEANQAMQLELTKEREAYNKQSSNAFDVVEKVFEVAKSRGDLTKKNFSLDLFDGKKDFGLSEEEHKAVTSLFNHQKAVGNMTISGNTTGDVARVDRGVELLPEIQRNVHIRSFMTQGTTDGTEYAITRESGSEGVPTTVGEGITKPQVDYDFEEQRFPVQKIASWLRISEEMLEDTSGLRQFLQNRMVQKHLIAEDAQLLFGDGVGSNLTGLTINANNATDLSVSGITDANNFDAMLQSIGLQRSLERNVDRILQNPLDYYRQLSLKGTDAHYVQPIIFVGGRATLFGIPLIDNTAISQGNFLLGDFAMGAEIKFRTGVKIDFSTEDGTNFIDNNVTLRVEQRLALPIYYEDSFFYDSFANVIAAIDDTP